MSDVPELWDTSKDTKITKKRYFIMRWTGVEVPAWWFQGTSESGLGRRGWNLKEDSSRVNFRLERIAWKRIKCMAAVGFCVDGTKTESDYAKIAH